MQQAPLRIQMGGRIYTQQKNETQNSYTFTHQQRYGIFGQRVYTQTYNANATTSKALDESIANAEKAFEGKHIPKDRYGREFTKEQFLLLPEQTRNYYIAQDAKLEGQKEIPTDNKTETKTEVSAKKPVQQNNVQATNATQATSEVKKIEKMSAVKEIEVANSKEFSEMEMQFLDKVNNRRKEAGLPPLRLSKELNKGAQVFANQMASRYGMQHSSWIYGSLQVIAQFGGYHGTITSENIAMGYKDVHSTFERWKHSDDHDANIKNNRSLDVGVAKSGHYWIMVTGMPYAKKKQ